MIAAAVGIAGKGNLNSHHDTVPRERRLHVYIVALVKRFPTCEHDLPVADAVIETYPAHERFARVDKPTRRRAGKCRIGYDCGVLTHLSSKSKEHQVIETCIIKTLNKPGRSAGLESKSSHVGASSPKVSESSMQAAGERVIHTPRRLDAAARKAQDCARVRSYSVLHSEAVDRVFEGRMCIDHIVEFFRVINSSHCVERIPRADALISPQQSRNTDRISARP